MSSPYTELDREAFIAYLAEEMVSDPRRMNVLSARIAAGEAGFTFPGEEEHAEDYLEMSRQALVRAQSTLCGDDLVSLLGGQTPDSWRNYYLH